MRPSRLLIGWLLLTPLVAGAQEPDTAAAAPVPSTTDSTNDTGIVGPAVRFHPDRPPLVLVSPSALGVFGHMLGRPRAAPGSIADERAAALERSLQARFESLWGQTVSAALATVIPYDSLGLAAAPPPPPTDTLRPPVDDFFGEYADLGLQLQTRIETKMERNKNERCFANQLYNPGAGCVGHFLPQFDFQFNLRTGGVVADRVHVNVDYDTQREFDASNNISVYYQGRQDELVHRLEVGNVSFALPPSRFITSGVPSGNYGVQAIGQLGPMRFRSIVAQQKGNVVRDRIFTVGDRTLQGIDRDIEDYQLEPRRFFFTVDPHLFAGYPNIDILDGARMAALARSLADTIRPTRVYLYRLQLGTQPPNPNGPQFIVRGGNLPQQRGQIYEYLREGVDYYIDPSQLWVALVRPLNAATERLVVAYRVNIGGRDTTYAATGGTPDIEFVPEPQFANLVWDPSLRPSDPAFDREIRSVYRLGGEDLLRESVSLRIVTGSGADQEKPVAGTSDTYLEMFGMAQPTNASTFDFENRLWPRPSDPNFNRGAGGGTDTRLIRDYFVVFPSLKPFAGDGLVEPGNPRNDTLYTIPGQYLYSAQRPQTTYRLRTRYQSMGGGDAGTLMLGAIQLRQNSERIVVDGVTLTRGTDYVVDYDLGRVSFTRADTLFARPRQVSVQYEENPLFATVPTSIFGLVTQFPLDRGELSFTVFSQSQTTTFTRPTLGFEPAASIMAGVTGAFAFDAAPLTTALDRLPMVRTTAPSTITIQGEFATSRPRPNARGQAYVESFEGEGGIGISLSDVNWYYSSRPLPLSTLSPAILDTARASTLVWQNNAFRGGRQLLYFVSEIDSNAVFVGAGTSIPEQLLWLSLYPLHIGGLYDPERGQPGWLTGIDRPGQRWRSIRTLLSAGGLDLTRVEQLEFWTLIDTSAVRRGQNPVLAFDFGEISENTLAFAPETLYVGGATAPDSLYAGRRVQGADSLDTERDPLSRAFNAAVDDTGLPGDRIDTLIVVDRTTGTPRVELDVPICGNTVGRALTLGDARANCTVRNSRLDEEDLNQDNVLNLTSAQQPAGERLRRYVVDLSDPSIYNRVTTCYAAGRATPQGTECWVQVRLPFAGPSDSVNSPDLRRIQGLRLTMISGRSLPDDMLSTIPIARLRLVGSPWLKRAEQTLAGAAAEEHAGGSVIAAVIGTDDAGGRLDYQPPPGVIDQRETTSGEFVPGLLQINERALRLLATGLDLHDRAEAYYRFPEGEKNFMGYGELRVWARGRNRGWGDNGELHFFVKLGRDPNNFYMYRTPARSGETQLAWTDVRVDFERLYALRARVQNAFLRQSPDSLQCTGIDLELIQRSPVPAGSTGPRYAACEDGYMVYTTSPGLTPPNLAAVQEMAVGMIRVAADPGAPNALIPGDTLELWVNDIRLTDVVNTPGYAGQLAVSLVAGDVATLRVNVARKDPHFRQLAEQPSFLTDDALDLATSVRLEKFLPRRLGLALPLAVSHTSSASDPMFVSRSDIRGAAIDGLRTPRSSATSYSLSARRAIPLEDGALAPVLNNLTLRSTYATAASRSEYTAGEARSWTLGAEYTVAAAARTTPLPEWVRGALGALPEWLAESAAGRALRAAELRWNPTRFVLTSGLARSTDRRETFLKPAAGAADDLPRAVHGSSHVWRNTSALELRPLGGLSLRWDINSLRDLRDYGDQTPIAAVAHAERGHLLGMDIGLERERVMSTGLALSPTVASWIRPNLSFGTTFTFTRDPNARTLLHIGDSTSAGRLPRRLTSQQIFSASATIDLMRVLGASRGDSGILGRMAGVFQPVDLSFTRTLLSAFDGTAIDPPLGYQLGWGGVDDFREVEGRRATSAGITRTITASHSLSLPFGTALVNRYHRVYGTNWQRRLGESQAEIDNSTVTFPDVSFRWSFRPALLSDIITSIGSQAGVRRTLATTLVPSLGAGVSGEGAGGAVERSASDIRQLPLNASVVWAGGFSTSAGYNLISREDSRPGSLSTSDTREASGDIAKSFRPPRRWDLKSDIRVRAGYQESHTASYTFSTATGRRSRLTDNGRYAINLNADTDLADNLTFSLQGARVVTFDRNYDRRFTQTVITAVLQLDFFGGELR